MKEKKITCIVCPNGCELSIKIEDENIVVTGNKCDRGKKFAVNEIKDPRRSITTTVKTTSKTMKRLPVRTDGEIRKEDIFKAMREISKITIDKSLEITDVVIENIVNSGVNLIATTSLVINKEGEQ